ncbi:MAG: hypothetical protein EA378_01920 [Phycisphaerales bacterium]|nr:MAG: hypothetical protein EA378_01920 [Phycisphaerales bacterium]
MSQSPLHERLEVAAGDRSYRALAELTETNAETCRRYMQGQSPSAEFLSAFCAALGISGDWLLTGRGPMRVADATSHALKRADPGELLGAMANTLETLGSRVDRLEVFVQTLETRVRASKAASAPSGSTGSGGSGAGSLGSDGEPDGRAVQSDVAARGRIDRIARVVARRPPPPAD